jgi:hypothetical protein
MGKLIGILSYKHLVVLLVLHLTNFFLGGGISTEACFG